MKQLLHRLFIADPELAGEVSAKITPGDIPLLSTVIDDFLDDTIWGLSQETAFGRTIAIGFISLMQSTGDPMRLRLFHEYVRKFGEKGPALGKIMAEYLVPVLKLNEPALFKKFLQVSDIMLKKGVYTLYGPFKALNAVCRAGDIYSVSAYLDLLAETFSLDLTYKQCRPFTYFLPKAVTDFSPEKRGFQIDQLRRVINTDFRLADKFLEGISRGLGLLSKNHLDEFVSKGLEKLKKSNKLCARFLSLESKMGLDTFTEMQVTVPLSQIRPAISRYVNARTGFPIPIKAVSSLPNRFLNDPEFFPPESVRLACSDGKSIYLPDEINEFDDKNKNLALYKCLAKLEAAFFEFGTFDFDLEKMRCPEDFLIISDDETSISDFERFIDCFSNKRLASELFTIFEQGRINYLLSINYPGLLRQAYPILREAFGTSEASDTIVGQLYQEIALDVPIEKKSDMPANHYDILEKTVSAYRTHMIEHPCVETSAELVLKTYPILEEEHDSEYFLKTPFGRKIAPDLYFSSFHHIDRLALLLKKRLEEQGIRVYRSQIRNRLSDNNGKISLSDVKELAIYSKNHPPWKTQDHKGDSEKGMEVDLSNLDLSSLLDQTEWDISGISPETDTDITGSVYFYKEWDGVLGDYLHHHTRVCRRDVPPLESEFYEKTVSRYQGLVKRIRYAFELLKPEGLSILREWLEGDEFDYRALLDFAMDKKAGIMPSDRLYIKRIKQQRDVAVLLLVDLSRSTANSVLDSAYSVLDVEKEAIVLFCEALEVVGDTYAIAGFSGTGRLGVDYFNIKDFDEVLDDTIRKRINAMSPQRSTRMGAAIRHAVTQLENVLSRVKLLIIIGDGFPNDVDYKKDYAILDTRKAISEARSKNIHTHALTVNIAGDPKLDELYGNVHHNIISDIRELPDKLPRIYSTLTRS